jgi:diguanylate cyclase (GGDEF)-like protein
MIDDYVVGASNTSSYAPGTTVDRLRSVPVHLVQRAVEERTNVLDDKHGVLPLALAEQVLGLAYLNRPAPGERDLDLLQLFASQAAAAVRNAALYELATVDSTTRVFRKSFTLERLVETLKLAWRKSFPVSALMLDIDDFRDLNARHGHIVGDRTLRHLAALLRANVRDSDIVGRFGGDEFLAVLIDANHEGAAVVLRRLYGALGRESGRPRPEGLPPVRATLGAAALEPDDGSYRALGFPDFRRVAETLVAEADEAMYRVRREPAAAGEVPALSWTRFFAG